MAAENGVTEGDGGETASCHGQAGDYYPLYFNEFIIENAKGGSGTEGAPGGVDGSYFHVLDLF